MHEWIESFIASLTLVPNVSEACRRAGITRQAAYKRRESDPDFAARWDDAVEVSTDDLVGECYRRAKEGCDKPVFYKGGLCGMIREYSDTLAIFLLKAHRRDTYGDKVRAEHSGPNGGPIEIDVTKLSDAELREIVEGTGGGGT